MPEFSEQAKLRTESFTGKIEVALSKARKWIQQYLRSEKNTTARFRLGIVFYELGSLMRMLTYREVSPKSPRCGAKEDLRTDIGDGIVNLMILAEILNIDSGQAIAEAFERLQNNEWRKHDSRRK